MTDYLDKLSLVLLTYERQSYALRAMKFWIDKGVELYVVDGSKTPISNVDFIKNSLVKYKHDPRSWIERLDSTLNSLSKPYIKLISDDDFIFPKCLNSCVEFLENNSDYSSCTGQTISFEYLLDKKKVILNEVYKGIESHNIDSEDPKKRLIKHFKFLYPTCTTGVNRLNLFKISYRNYLEKQFKLYNQFEYHFELIIAFSGKLKIINQVLWLKSNENKRIYDPIHNEPKNSFEKFWNKKKSKNEFTEIIANQFWKKSDISIDEAKKIILSSLNLHFERVKNQKKIGSKKILIYHLKKILSYFPSFLFSFLRSIKYSNIHRKNTKILSKHFYDKKALEEILIIIENFYK